MNNLFFAVLVLFLPGSLCENPGIQAAITDKGLGRLVSHHAIAILENALPSASIPDISGKHSHIHYKVRSIKIDSLNIPGCSLTPSASGLTLASSGISVKVSAHVKAQHKHLIHISASTDIRVDLSAVSFSITVKLGRDATSGQATLSTSACSGDVGNVHVSFHHSSAWLYKLFDHDIKKALKKGFQSAFCSKVTSELNDKGNQVLKSLPLISKFEDLAMINYTLTQDPAYTSTYMAVFLKGAFQPQNQQIQIPFTPAPFPPVKTDGRMLYVWFSDYVLNSAGYVLQQTGVLHYNITRKLLPESPLLQLNTSFFKDTIQSFHHHFPNMGIEIALKATKPPIVHFTPKGGELSAFGSIDMNVILPNNHVVTAFTLGISAELDVDAEIQSDGRITGKATLVSSDFTLDHSIIGKFNATMMKFLKVPLEFALKAVVIPALNRYASKGLPIPTIDGISLVNPKLTFGENYGLVATDINYKMKISEAY